MTLHTDAFAELDRELRFFPLGVDHPRTLSREQIAHYNEKGYVYPIDIFSADEIAEIRRYFDGLLESALAAGWNSYEMTNWHKHCRGVWDIVQTESRILDYIQDLLGETVIIRHSHFFAKLPGDGKRVSWHQDASYWPLSPSKVVSAWLAIDDVDIGNGALQVIPRSHRNAQIAFADMPRRTTYSTRPSPIPRRMATIRWRWSCGPGRSRCTATGYCTAPSPTNRTGGAAGWRCASSHRTCGRSRAGISTRLCAGAWSPAATGPTTRARRRTRFR